MSVLYVCACVHACVCVCAAVCVWGGGGGGKQLCVKISQNRNSLRSQDNW